MWRYEIGRAMKGPVSDGQFGELAAAGIVTARTPVWREGMERWRPAADTELERFFPAPALSAAAATAASAAPIHPVLQAPPVQWSDRPIPPLAPLAPLTGALAVLLRLFAAVSALYLVFHLYAVVAIRAGATVDPGRSLAAGLLSGAVLTVFAVSAIFVLRWTWRAMRNLRAKGVETGMSPGWAVGWYFVPFACFLKPAEGMTQIWRGSALARPQGTAFAAADTLGPQMGLLAGWWGTWLAFALLGQVSVRYGMVDAQRGVLSEATYLIGAAGYGAGAVSALLLFAVIRRITDLQQRAFFA